MQLLSAKTTKDNKAKSDADRINRIKRLNQEETEAVQRLNKIRVLEKEENERIAQGLQENKSVYEVKKTILIKEVESLEARKREAVKPVQDIEEKAQKVLNDNMAVSNDLKIRQEKVKQKEADVIERLENITDKEQELIEREGDINRRMIGVKAAEEEIKSSSEKLADKWVKFHEEVHIINADIERREKEVADQKKANEIYKQTLDAEKATFATERKAIKDGYDSLAKAREEILGRST